MKHILLPTDFSDNSWNAVKYAVQFYKDETCTFNLINTYRPLIYSPDHFLGYVSQFSFDEAIKESSREGLEEFLKKIADTFGDNPKHTFKIHSIFDSLVLGIKGFMSKNRVDLIIMGTQGATGAKEVLFGSNAVNVFKEIKTPTLSIPSGFEYEKPLEILFPTDLEVDYNTFQMEILKKIVITHNSRMNTLHVSSNDLTDFQNKKKVELEAQFKDIPFLFHLHKGKNVLAAIDEFQMKSKINLLVMLNNKHSFFENLFFKSNIDQIGFHLKGPFLVIPSK